MGITQGMTNKHGLPRRIPNNIKYLVRQEDGFGCIHCGLGIYEYEHIDPEFKDATAHDAKSIGLLCPTQHSKVTRKFTSKATVKRWKANPWCKTHGHVHDRFDIDTDNLEIWVGGTKVQGFEKIISIDDNCILSVKPPEEIGGQFRLSAVIHDNQNQPILTIADNEWKASSDAFDIVSSEGKIGIRKDGRFVLRIYLYPPNVVVFEEIDMLYNGMTIRGNSTSLSVLSPVSGGGQFDRIGSFESINNSESLFRVFSDRPGINLGACTVTDLNIVRPRKPVSSNKCERNSDCPCGSGKRYKKCCIPKYDYDL